MRIATENDILLLTEEHEQKAMSIYSHVEGSNRAIIAIGGLSGCGKSEIAYKLREVLDMPSVLVHVDDYYSSHPDKRDAWRYQYGMIGSKEIEWFTLDSVIKDFKDKKIIHVKRFNKYLNDYYTAVIEPPEDCVLIVEGLFALNCSYCDYKFHIDSTYAETCKFRQDRGKEVMNARREKVLKCEEGCVEYLSQQEGIIKI